MIVATVKRKVKLYYSLVEILRKIGILAFESTILINHVAKINNQDVKKEFQNQIILFDLDTMLIV